ncbi:DUF1700 domain-containing protein [Paenibacillus sp. J2TS4]|uniref:DUF1700 domain-containing protein n=1 Tax=Paenibacillus sp. J2TS4 TaxID=2807194 RepID=UPI001B035BB1|nr:DUF1700 domain-containing protein [Paenibacillus sp. J2TS4]GIP34053.1 hypothetical protein J2TS4_32630 [Paenibacillus sp. J2TS4]
MSPQGRAYLEALYNHLAPMPEEERMDAVREIESHLEEGIKNGQSESVLLNKLGDARKLARAYIGDYYVSESPGRSLTWQEGLRKIGFFISSGFVSMFVIPILAVLAGGLAFSAGVAVLGGILRTMGLTWIQMQVAPGIEVPVEYSFIVGGIAGGILFLLAFLCWKGLRSYLRFLSSKYRSFLPIQRI